MRCSAPRAALAAGLLAVAIISFDHTADAAPVQYGTRYSEYVSNEAVSWDHACAAASASNFIGSQGDLATVALAAEDDFLQKLVGVEAGHLLTIDSFGTGQPSGGSGNVYINIGTIFAGIATGQ